MHWALRDADGADDEAVTQAEASKDAGPRVEPPLADQAIARIDPDALAQAILRVGISTLDFHVHAIVKGEDGNAEALAGLIAANYAEIIRTEP